MNYKSEIVKTIQKMSGKYSAHNIFHDWCELCALSIQNACVLKHDDIWQRREEMYKSIFTKYTNEEKEDLVYMFNILPEAIEEKMGDILGEIYMESGAGNKYVGQFFTPFHLSELTAQLGLDKYDGRVVDINEPSIGSGGMIIAAAKAIKEKGYNYQTHMKVVGQDLDWLAVYMSYVQLSLLGIDAVIVQGNTLSDPYRKEYPNERTLRTPRNTGAIF